ncbi:hypothetical protein Dimus_015263 [Dionaea muscipula]
MRGRPVPDPPQLLQTIRPDPEQVRQPTSPSDHLEHKQATRPVPLQVWHLGCCLLVNGPIMGWFWSMTDLMIAAPARTLRPVANWDSTIGPMTERLNGLYGFRVEAGGDGGGRLQKKSYDL